MPENHFTQKTQLASGEWGAFEGPSADRVVLPRYAADGRWSEQLVALLVRALSAGGTFIDVGAHVGLVSIPVLLQTPARGVAFEPAPLNAECLRRNALRHNVETRLAVHELALWDEPGTGTLSLCDDNSGDHRMLTTSATHGAARSQARVRAGRLDDALDPRDCKRPIVMKVDTQGAEARVLRGGQRVLSHVDALVLEYWPAGLLRVGDHASQLEPLLSHFSHAALLQQGAPVVLKPRSELLHALDCLMAQDAGDEGFFDVLLTAGRDLFGDA